MQLDFTPAVNATTVSYKSITVDGLEIAYREAGNSKNPKMVLLHGFPSSSHQYRNLIPALAEKFHVLAPDYPGFGNSEMPDPSQFAYTFDHLAEVVEHFLEQKGFDHFGPVGFRILTRKPQVLDWLVIQNTNAYEVGFTAAWGGLRGALWLDRSPATEAGVAGLLELGTVKAIYQHGSQVPELISPDNWNSDFAFLERPGARAVQMDLFYDYRTNVDLYPKWQAFLKKEQPRTLIFWGQGDIFFTPEGGEAFLKDLPDAEIHRLNAGHFAVEDCLDYIATNMHSFFHKKVAAGLVTA